MKAKGIFVYKNLQKREKGSFTNKETGELINYDSCYVLVADEIAEDNKITERRFKISEQNTSLINELAELEPYTRIELEFDVAIYSANAKITPIGFEIA